MEQRGTEGKLVAVEARLKQIDGERKAALQTQNRLRKARDEITSSLQLATRFRMKTEQQQNLQSQARS